MHDFRCRPNLEGMIRMKRIGLIAVAAMLGVAPAFAQSDNGSGRAVVTIFAKHNEVAPNVAQQDVSAKVDGKDAAITGWAPFKGPNDGLELIVLIDSGARNLGRQFDEMKQFVQNLNPDTKVAVGYMQNGYAAMAGPFSTDHKQVMAEFHLPGGPSTNPYFTLSDLAHRWPSQDAKVRREVVMLSDGVDPENRRFDPEDPYVEAAIHDCVQAGMVVYTIFWRSGFEAPANSMTAQGGQSLLIELTQATGGNSYFSGENNPVSFQPFFDDLQRRFENQYALEFAAHVGRKPEVETLKLKVEGLGLQVTAPQQVAVRPGGAE
jgi:hypothetical protein